MVKFQFCAKNWNLNRKNPLICHWQSYASCVKSQWVGEWCWAQSSQVSNPLLDCLCLEWTDTISQDFWPKYLWILKPLTSLVPSIALVNQRLVIIFGHHSIICCYICFRPPQEHDDNHHHHHHDHHDHHHNHRHHRHHYHNHRHHYQHNHHHLNNDGGRPDV